MRGRASSSMQPRATDGWRGEEGQGGFRGGVERTHAHTLCMSLCSRLTVAKKGAHLRRCAGPRPRCPARTWASGSLLLCRDPAAAGPPRTPTMGSRSSTAVTKRPALVPPEASGGVQQKRWRVMTVSCSEAATEWPASVPTGEAARKRQRRQVMTGSRSEAGSKGSCPSSAAAAMGPALVPAGAAGGMRLRR